MNFWIVIIADFHISDYARWNHHKSFELPAPLTFWVPSIFEASNQNFIMEYEPSDQIFIDEK